MAFERFASQEKIIGGKEKMTTEQLTKTEQYLKGLSDQELSTLVEELEKETHEESSPLRKAIDYSYGDEFGIFPFRVYELLYPILKELNSRLINKTITESDIDNLYVLWGGLDLWDDDREYGIEKAKIEYPHLAKFSDEEIGYIFDDFLNDNPE